MPVLASIREAEVGEFKVILGYMQSDPVPKQHTQTQTHTHTHIHTHDTFPAKL
jgi:hypothetical protein